MKKYEEEHYLFENIRSQIYPWVSAALEEPKALNGKHISDKDTPVITFVGELKILLVIKRGEDSYEILKDAMLPPDCDVEMLYQLACENLARNVEFVIGNTMYGAFAVLADGWHEASSLCLQHIWKVCAEKLDDDLVIMVPLKDTVLFASASQDAVVEKMRAHAEQAYVSRDGRIGTEMYLFTKDGKELMTYGETEH